MTNSTCCSTRGAIPSARLRSFPRIDIMKSKTSVAASEELNQRIRKLFNVPWVPKIPFGIEDLPELVRRAPGKMAVAGVQKKASVILNKKTKQIEIALGKGTHILKP